VPTFCRHNRLVQNCPICSREQEIEMRPVISSGTPGGGASNTSARSPTPNRTSSRTGSASRASSGLRVRQLARGADDGYHSQLVPGLRSSADAERLAEELAFAARRLARVAVDPPGLYAEVGAKGADLEERTWLAFLIAYLCPLDGDDPFASIRRARTSWASGEAPDLEGIETGPRSGHNPARGARTIDAYRVWTRRAGSQAAAFTGESTWTPERRFARVFERLALPGLNRDAKFDLLVTLGSLGAYELSAGSLQFGGPGVVTVAAKRMLGIGDSLLLERRAAELARACDLPLAALDVGLYNWERGERATLGLGTDAEPDPDALASARAALGL
jgi:hypothetical protein